ncbi:MAG: aminotransferase class V-fold PLP-dependent enzyme [Pirellulaceae bacterium]
MRESRSSRRDFLSTSSKLGVASAAAACLLDARNSFGALIRNPAWRTQESVDFTELGKQFSLADGLIYLNHASIGAIPIPVQEARAKYLRVCETNPWLHMWGGQWDEPREEVRGKAATLLGCDPAEIAITHNTTEMFNTLAYGLPLDEVDEVLFSSLNHPGASLAFEHVAPARGYSVRQFDYPLDTVNEATIEQITDVYRQQISDRTRLLVLPHIDNTVGLRHPVKEIASMARQLGVEFVAVDAAQSVGMIPVDVAEMGVDVLATSPHKWLGAPKGLGLAYVSKAIHENLQAMWVTWGQQRWPLSARRYEDYGTRNLAELLALGDAIDFLNTVEPRARANRLRELLELTSDLCQKTNGCTWKSASDWNQGSAVIAVNFERGNSAEIAQRLFEENRIVVRPFGTQGLNSLRISPNIYTPPEHIEQLFDIIGRA